MTAAGKADFQQTLIGLLHRVSVEVTPHGTPLPRGLRKLYDPGTDIFVSFLPGADWRDSVEATAELRRRGFSPVPHIAARNLASRDELADFLSQLAAEARVDAALVIAGDIEHPRGPFDSALDALQTGLFEAHGIRRIAFAGYPEGHPRIADEALMTALAAKLDWARAADVEPFIVTQFCFAAAPILAWLDAIRAAGVAAPVRVGLAGPASLATLVRFALRCGVGNSLRTLQARTNMIGRLLSDAGPDDLLRELATGLAARPQAGVDGLHFFPFGGLEKTSDWIAAALTRLYAQITGAAGRAGAS